MLDRSWVGRRVVIRYSIDTDTGTEVGATTDALGDLVALDGSTADVLTRRGPVAVLLHRVRLARLVEPSPRDQLALEQVAARGWQAAVSETSADGWLLRADHGWTGRANSALVLRSPMRSLDAVLADVERFYRAQSLPVRIAVPLPAHSALDRALAARGYLGADDSDVLAGRVDVLRAATGVRHRPDDVTVELALRPDDDWLAGYHYRGGSMPATARALLTRHDRVRFATARDRSGAVLGVGRAVVDDGWMGLTALDVAPAHRRRGIAVTVIDTLAAWAAQEGAERAYLQVMHTNRPAHALYSALGLYVHHSYRYRTAPTLDA